MKASRTPPTATELSKASSLSTLERESAAFSRTSTGNSAARRTIQSGSYSFIRFRERADIDPAPSSAVRRPAGPSSTRSINWPAFVLGFYPFLGALLSFLGWVFSVTALKDWNSTGVTIKANTCVGILLASLALICNSICWNRRIPLPILMWCRITAGVLVTLLGSLTLLEHLTGWDLRIDQLLFSEEPGSPATFAPGRFGITASVEFMIVGAALLLLHGGPRSRITSSVLGFAVAAFSLISLVGYVFGVQSMHAGPALTSIAIQTSSMFLALGLGLIAVVRERAIGAIVSAPGPGGMMARRMLLTAIWIPPTLCWVGLVLVKDQGISAPLALASVAVCMMVVLAIVVLINSHMVEHAAAVALDKEQQFRSFFDLGLAGAAQADPATFRYTMVNDRLCEIVGYTRQELLGRNVADLTHPDDRAADAPQLAKLASGELPQYDREKRYVHKSGRIIWVHVVARAVRDERGIPIRTVALIKDITTRREALDAVRRQSETFYHVVSNNPFGVYIVDADFKLREISQGARKVFQNIQPLLHRDFAEIMHIIWAEPFASEAIARFRHTLATGEPFTAKSTDKERGDIQGVESYDWRIERIVLPDGRFGVVCYFYDLSERLEWERALARSESRFRAIFNSTFEYIELMTPEGVILQANQATVDSTGTTEDALSGTMFWDSAWWADRPSERERLRACVSRAAAGEFVRFEVEYTTKFGDCAIADACLSPIRDDKGNVFLLVFEGHDVTLRKRAEAELARHRENLQLLVEQKSAELAKSTSQLQHAERLAALGNLAAGLGHDLANLTLPIRMRLDAIRASNVNDDVQQDLTEISKALDHLGNMSAGMRLMAMDPAREEASRPVQSMDVWCSHATAVLRAALPRHIELRCEMHTRLVPKIPSHRLTQAVFNLVQNAGEAMASQPKGLVHMWDEVAPPRNGQPVIRIVIADNGPGMSPEVLARCFEPYFSTKGRAISTGMGLAMVRGVVESAGGRVSVESTPGKGTTFSLDLPASQLAHTHADASDIRHDHGAATPCTVFLSVSDPRLASLTAALLEGMGAKVVRHEPPAPSASPSPAPGSEIWVGQDPSHSQVAAFIASSRSRRVIALRTPAHVDGHPGPFVDGTHGRVVVFPTSTSPSALRAALNTALRASTDSQEGSRP